MHESEQLVAQLAVLEERFRQRLNDELDALNQLANQLQTNPAALQDLRDRLHKLAGSSGTFGYAKLGERCRELEVQAQAELDAPQPSPQALDALGIATQHLHLLLQHNENSQDEPQRLEPLSSDDGEQRHIGLLIQDPAMREQMERTLSSFGYQISCFATPATMQGAGLDAVIIDASPPGSRLLEDTIFHKPCAQALPLLVISSQDNFHSRLQAVRAGATGFFTKPVDLPELESRLERCFNTQQGGPFRVLIVDDDTELSARYALVLSNAGMLIDTLSDPNQLLDKMHNFSPEVVLMDLSMPEYSGPELAQVIRLNDDWLRVPIVYLSAETNAERQMSALLKAGDDFITKPISDSALLTTVYARAQRARMVSDALARDSLTGLLKHADIKEQVELEGERAQRSKTPLAIAMIDIDHFKQVNDQHGHASGDSVIRALSNLLRQRLRKVDRLGRYGGEEFVAVLPGCSQQDAVNILDNIRQAFEALQFSAEQSQFNCTFSAGISTCSAPEWDTSALLEQADRALYHAKKAGRNRICTAGEERD
ncbi:diguanylate cyclase [Halopseudomonas sp.]|uniref:diguanylate cyclase n=1 Tax=Halopseudomonas sp. TaxID=2901191 RepID=UPI00311E3A1D